MTAWIDRQLPQGHETFLDHVGFFAADLAAAGYQVERLGFQISPVNLHQNADATGALKPSGTSNRLIMLRRGFIEVLAATSDTPLADQLKAGLARYPGLHLIALTHEGIPEVRARLTEAGFKMQQVVNLRRHIPIDGRTREVKWSVLRPEPGVMAEGRVQICHCHTPETVWIDGRDQHANAADGLTDLLVCVAGRREAVARYARYLGRQAVERGGVSAFALDRGGLLFVEQAEAARILPGFKSPPSQPFIAGQAIRSADLAATRAALARGGIKPVFADGGMICVGPADALGGYLLFHAPALADPWTALAARS